MAYKINIFTGQPDIVGSGGGGGAQVPNYVFAFNAAASWGAASGGIYTITLLQTTHLKGATPLVQVWEKVGSDYFLVGFPIKMTSAGNIILEVSESPDNRFEGYILVSENN